MTESVITEFSGNQRESVSRVYYYSPTGVRVADRHDVVRRLYRFDPSSNTITENLPSQPGKLLRRFVFDNYGMLEETFSFGQPPRTFRYENGGRQIVMREGGEYGAVGKTFTFEGNGVAETAFGRDGTIERVYSFDPRGETVTIRNGGWYGDVDRILVFERLDVSVFLDPEAFLQFLVFTEKSARERETEIDEEVAKIRESAPGGSRFAYTGPRHAASEGNRPAGTEIPVSGQRVQAVRPSGARSSGRNDTIIDFISDSDSAPRDTRRGYPAASDRSAAIPFEERYPRGDEEDRMSRGESSRIPLEERFRSSREEDRTLSKGRSANIPLEERFQGTEPNKDDLTPGQSTRISYEERKAGRRLQ